MNTILQVFCILAFVAGSTAGILEGIRKVREEHSDARSKRRRTVEEPEEMPENLSTAELKAMERWFK